MITMAEQISHKKSLRTGKDKRSLLKDFYHLNSEEENRVDTVELEKDSTPTKEESDNSEDEGTITKKLEVVDRPINEQTFKELVATHNKLLGKETATNSSIKNTIYENYYDLVKVNDKLEEINSDKLQEYYSTLKKCVEDSL